MSGGVGGEDGLDCPPSPDGKRLSITTLRQPGFELLTGFVGRE
jgi:hypothetical protein